MAELPKQSGRRATKELQIVLGTKTEKEKGNSWILLSQWNNESAKAKLFHNNSKSMVK